MYFGEFHFNVETVSLEIAIPRFSSINLNSEMKKQALDVVNDVLISSQFG